MNTNASSLLAVAFAFFAFNASATTHVDSHLEFKDAAVQLDLSDRAVEGNITMTALVQLTNGNTRTMTQKYRNMNQAVDGYVQFVSTLPHGTRLVKVKFTNDRGEVVFEAQG